MSKLTVPTTARLGGGHCRIALVALFPLLGFGLAAPAFGSPDANTSLVDDCDDTIVGKSDDEYVCEPAQTAARYAKSASEKMSKWICVQLVAVFPDQADSNGWARLSPVVLNSYTWLNMATINRFDRKVANHRIDVLLPPWAMRVAPVYAPHLQTQAEQVQLSRTYIRRPDTLCSGSPLVGDPHNIQIKPLP